VDIAIEGPSGAGKTTLINRLIASSDIFEIIPEYNILAGGAKNFPSPPKTRAEALQSSNFFLKLELERQTLIKKAIERGRMAVQDRSLFTCIAFDYAKASTGGFDIWQETERTFLETDGLILPKIIFFLDVSFPNAVERVTKRNDDPKAKTLANPAFNEAFRNYFLTEVSKKVRVCRINANADLEQVESSVLSQF